MCAIDLNCDLGEGYPDDAELMSIVTSANIACGGHAGDESTMAATVRLAIENRVAIGAHPGFRDKANFGRTYQTLSQYEITDLVAEQLTLLRDIAEKQEGCVSHVKPHGALYNRAADDAGAAAAIVKAVNAVDPSLILFGLAGSMLVTEGKNAGLRIVSEAFADRRYSAAGRLASRSIEGAVIDDAAVAAEQALKIAKREPIKTIDGEEIVIDAETICLHGDGITAVSTARLIRTFLEDNGIEVRSYIL
ncbi:MAG: LamB/YcsF family protein [Acidobacteriota bacterium]|nr:MAG: LamB/YcsF family protein [Acidobacteriota bacterium]